MKYYPHFLLTLVCLAAVFYLSFFRPSELPLAGVPLIDKWTHVVMYFGLTLVFWFDYHLYSARRARFASDVLLFCGFVLPVVLGGVIEIAQAHWTGGWRSGEMADFAADTLGSLLGFVLGRGPLAWLLTRLRFV